MSANPAGPSGGMKRKRFKAKGGKVIKKSFAARAVAPILRRHIELKAVDVPDFANSFTSANNFQLLNGMTTGAAVWNHVGRNVTMQSVLIRGKIKQQQAGAAPSDDFIRAALIYDKQSDGATPSWQDVFAAVDQTGTVSTDAYSPANLDNADRFVILRDCHWQIPVSQGAGGAVDRAIADTAINYQIKWFVRLPKLPVVFKAGANAGTSADITTGALYFVTRGLQNAANFQWEFIGTSRVRYTDA